MNEPEPSLNKMAQMLVVVAGFFASVALLASRVEPAGWAEIARRGVTLALATGLAVRYWWVILLLDWPFRPARAALLLLAWSALVAAAGAGLPQAWAFSLAALSAVGALTEGYNAATRQWAVGPTALAESLRHDHRNGLVGAALGAASLVAAGVWLPTAWLVAFVGLMTLADWARLAEMIARHRRLLSQPEEYAR